MADLIITPADVIAAADASRVAGTAGETVAAGKAVYQSSQTQRWLLADADSVTAEARIAGGIALNGAAVGQPLMVIKGGDVALGAVLTPGAAYYLSDDAGGICPLTDLAAGDYVCLLGLATSASVLALDIQFPNVAL